MNPFDYESVLLGYVLRYGKDVAGFVLPRLTADRFIYSKEMMLGAEPDHRHIWRAITEAYLLDHRNPVSAVVIEYLPESYRPYLLALVARLEGFYQIYEIDPEHVIHVADMVDKAGSIYQIASSAHKLGKVVEQPEAFSAFVSEVGDVDDWARNYLSGVRGTINGQPEGYKPVGLVVDSAYEVLDRVHSGELRKILPCGMPSLMGRGLFPMERLALIMAMSSSGKSAYAHGVNLGTALGMVAMGLPGCVAINSLEEDQDSLVLKLAGMLGGINTFKYAVLGQYTEEDTEKLMYWLDVVSHLPIYIDPTNMLKTSVLQYRAEGLHSSEVGPILQISIDYIESLDWQAEGMDNKEQAIDVIIHKARYAAILEICLNPMQRFL